MNMHIDQGKEFAEHQTKALKRVTYLGMITNIILVIIKFLAGIFAHSQVLVADAVHSFSDLATDLAILIGVRYWNAPADKDHPHGHAKIETMITMFIGIALLLVGIGLIRSAIHSIDLLISGTKLPKPGIAAFFAALLSIISKEWLYWKTLRVGKDVHSTAIMANAWHHRSDALSSIPAALAVLAILLFGEKYVFLDPVGTILVSLMLIYASAGILRPTLSILLDHSISNDALQQIEKAVLAMKEVDGVHKIRSRYTGSEQFAIDLHIQVDPQMPVVQAHSLSHRIQEMLHKTNPEIVDVVIHIEPDRSGETDAKGDHS